MKKFNTIFLIFAFLLTLTGCNMLFNTPYNPLFDYDYSEMKLVQLEPPYENQKIAIIYTTLGEITAMLFPEYAPKTIENFIARAEDGFYEGKKILSVINGEYFITGASNEEGTQGFTQDGKLIENEYSVNLWPFKGALLAFSGQQGYGDSRFIALGSAPFTDELAESYKTATNKDGSQLIPDELIKAYEENDNLAQALGYTIFAQIIEGFDILNELLAVETTGEGAGYRPVDDIFIEKIVITEYNS